MIKILFHEKPGCINNTKQKKLLTEAGYQVDARDLLAEPWTREKLEHYFSGMPVAQRFNRSAPLVTSGQVVPEQLEEDEAYDLMLKEPLLIRRPLMKIAEHYLVGFEEEKINQIIALSWDEKKQGDLEACPRTSGHACDDTAVGGEKQ